MIKRIGDYITRYRHLVFIVILVLTGFFAYEASKLDMYTIFTDLIPPKHPYTQIHKKFEKTFGGANIIGISLERKEGDIYNIETLSKIKKITEAVEFTRGVNNYQIYSIARDKAKDIKATAWGLEVKPVMWPNIPQTQKEIDVLKDMIHSSDMIYGQVVSRDDNAALITAAFLEGRIDYRYIFNRLRPILKSLEDENTSIYMAGEPILYGWVYHHLREITYIFILTVIMMTLVLVVFSRRVLGIVIPIFSAILSAVWGVGFMGLMGYNFDPLILVVPFLISARTLSHSVQMTERYIEEYERLGDKKAAAASSFEELLIPGSVSIITDALGVLIIAVAPIPLLTKLAWGGCFWVMSNIVTVLILNPILYPYLPAPRIAAKGKRVSRLSDSLVRLGKLCYGRYSKWVIVACACLIAVWSGLFAATLTTGDSHPGSPLLWPDSEYNQSVKKINAKFPGLDQLIVVVEGKEKDVIKLPSVLGKMEALQRYMCEMPEVGGTASVVQLTKKINTVLHYDYSKWALIPKESRETAGLFSMAQQSGEPGDFDQWVSYDFKDSNVVVFLKDHKGDTIRNTISRVKEFIGKNPLKEVEFKLAGGFIGILAAANEVILDSTELNLFLVLSFTFACCGLAYQSFVAGFLFIISLCLANFFTLAVMAVKNIGLNINTLPVISLGIGLGVDYGLYVVSRIGEEYQQCRQLERAITLGIATSGRAVLITAVTMVVGIIFWYFSPLRFQAEMGILLSIVLIMNLLGGVLLLPTLIFIVKPRFILKGTKKE